MAKVHFDESLRSRFDLAAGATELCDDDGKPVAYVVSAEQYRKLFAEWIKGQFSDEQAERAWHDYQRNGGVSTAEAWRRVEKRLRDREGAA